MDKQVSAFSLILGRERVTMRVMGKGKNDKGILLGASRSENSGVKLTTKIAPFLVVHIYDHGEATV